MSFRGSRGGGVGATEMFNVIQEMEDFPFFPLTYWMIDKGVVLGSLLDNSVLHHLPGIKITKILSLNYLRLCSSNSNRFSKANQEF